MISYEMEIKAPKELYHILDTNDKTFGKNRATIQLSYENNKIKIILQSKDFAAFRAAHKSIENAILIWQKAGEAL
jgi:tRNA threonylcarbamoyladenosine modification (KEOPS) complex  Pcc1 subunit